MKTKRLIRTEQPERREEDKKRGKEKVANGSKANKSQGKLIIKQSQEEKLANKGSWKWKDRTERV